MFFLEALIFVVSLTALDISRLSNGQREVGKDGGYQSFHRYEDVLAGGA